MRSYAVDRYRGVDLGWDGIFKKLIRELKKDNPSVLLLDAQQKAGALYVYVARSGPRSEELIARATRESRTCLLYTSPSPRDPKTSRMPSSA